MNILNNNLDTTEESAFLFVVFVKILNGSQYCEYLSVF